jgi:hypothetical protein
MSDLRDGFIRTMDSEETGINGKILKFNLTFEQIDSKLYNHIVSNNVQPNFFVLRWIMLMLS